MPASPVHHTSVDKATTWDGPAAERAFDKKSTDLPLFYAWYDKGEVDPDATGEDKEDGWGPHHDVNAAGVPGAANLAAVHAAVARLNADKKIPAGDRQGVHNHLAAHLKDAGVDPKDIPELKSQTPRKGRQHRELPIGREFRFFQVGGLEIRAGVGGDDNFAELTGLVIRYGVPYTVYDMWGEFEETIHFGAATDVLASPLLDARFMFNHADMPYSRTGSTTCPLTLTEDRDGVHVKAIVDLRMQGAAELYRAIDNELITQMSVGMQVDPDGDIWSGEDDYGMPNKRDIVRLSNIFDASAVTFPASPTTDIAVARAAWDAVPLATRERTRKLWEDARDVRAGRGTPAQAEAVMHVLERLQAVDAGEEREVPAPEAPAAPEGTEAPVEGEEREDEQQIEERSEPTAVDPKITDGIATVLHALVDLQALQTTDPDSNTDPVDKKIAGLLQEAHNALTQAQAAQATDGNDDKETKSAPQGDPDGTSTSASGEAPTPEGNDDGTGSRSVDPLKARREALRERARHLAIERARLLTR